jgi:hypothetical protein
MDEVTTKPKTAETMTDLGASLAQASTDATRRFCEQGQSIARSITEWNGEISQFVSNRIARNSETIGRMTKCTNLPEAFAIQSRWIQDAADDYIKQMNRVMELNNRIMGGLLEPIASTEAGRSAHRR